MAGRANNFLDFGQFWNSTLQIPLRVSTWAMKMKPTIQMSRHDPSGPMSARWGGNLTIQSLQGPI
eukprot:scaffold3261_cov146-Skeletonema_marinoi.AAC.2